MKSFVLFFILFLIFILLATLGYYFYIFHPELLKGTPFETRLEWEPPSPETVYPVDWATSDGKAFHHVKVTKVEPDSVTITHDAGLSVLDISTLDPDLRRRLNYNPEYLKQEADDAEKAAAAATNSQAAPPQ